MNFICGFLQDYLSLEICSRTFVALSMYCCLTGWFFNPSSIEFLNTPSFSSGLFTFFNGRFFANFRFNYLFNQRIPSLAVITLPNPLIISRTTLLADELTPHFHIYNYSTLVSWSNFVLIDGRQVLVFIARIRFCPTPQHR